MIIGTLRVRLQLSQASSLKGKRFILKGMKERLRKQFNISLSEIGEGKDLWQSAELAAAVVGDDRRHLNQILDQVKNKLSESRDVELTDCLLEFF